ncbi:MAG: prepilin-type N-terminal cleavage/methylation domain-containing protein [Bacilli bacterium]|nr:prepilin-type N-terminal cleavage/methylation domain-containing protein [Bacilli bacterium]
MKEKGFTLIELLAVIVILAIIALIATPVILNIIDDSRNSSTEQSINMYGKAVENAIADYMVNNSSKTIPKGSYTQTNNGKTLKMGSIEISVDYDGNKVECNTIQIKETGKVYLANCKVNGTDVDYVYGGEKSTVEPVSTFCVAKNSSEAGSTTIGTEYQCDVDPNSTEDNYTFYVLSTEGSNVNLLMNTNIADDYTYVDEDTIGRDVESYYNYGSSGWSKLSTEVATLTSSWKNITQSARLPKFEELANKNVCGVKTEKIDYVYDDDYDYNYTEGLFYYSRCPEWSKGNYWTGTRIGDTGVWAMNTEYNTLDSFEIFEFFDGEFKNVKFGIRPVITVSIFDLS